MGFTRTELDACRGATLPDLLGPQTRLLFVGINPGLWTAAVQAHFARRGNRFYPALYRAGILDRIIDASAGYAPEDYDHLLTRGVGITNLVPLATARADELTTAELTEGATRLVQRVNEVRPAVVAVLGVTAFRAAFRQPKAKVGRQPYDLGRSQLWVAPNPSGLNGHSTAATLAADYRELAIAAGIQVYSSSVGVANVRKACNDGTT